MSLSTSTEEINRKVQLVRDGFASGITLPIQARKNVLRDVYYALEDNKEFLKDELAKDFGKPGLETELTELFPTLAEVNYAIKHLDKWSKEEYAGAPLTLLSARPVVSKQPLGTVLVISPWNYPLFLPMLTIVSALAAGNTVVVKPSELVPHLSLALEKVLTAAVSPSILQFVQGGVAESTAVLKLKFDKIAYTGNGAVGRIVLEAAAKHLTPVLLELGGKSPTFVSASTNVQTAAKRIAWGKFTNCGQTCVAPDYVLVEAAVHDEFVAALKKALAAFYGDFQTSSAKVKYSSIVNARHFARLTDVLSKTKGKIVVGGTTDEKTNYIAPTVVDNVAQGDILLKEEIFGPILPIVKVNAIARDGLDFALETADTPLAAYIFSEKTSDQETIAAKLRSGGLLINDTLLQVGLSNVPFGGVGTSGTGHTQGKFGFEEFSHVRAVLRQPMWVEFLLKSRYPPLTRKDVNFVRRLWVGGNRLPRTGNVTNRGIKWFVFYIFGFAAVGSYLFRSKL